MTAFKNFCSECTRAYLSQRKRTSGTIRLRGCTELAQTNPKKHPKELVTALGNVAFLAKRNGEQQRAIKLFSQAFEHAEKLLEVDQTQGALWIKAYQRALSAGVFKKSPDVARGLKLRAKAIFRALPEPQKTPLEKTINKLKRQNGI